MPRRALNADRNRATAGQAGRAGSSPATAPMWRSRRPTPSPITTRPSSFVNAVAFIANAQDHHPDLSVHYNRCVVRFNTHDVERPVRHRFRMCGAGRRAARHEGTRLTEHGGAPVRGLVVASHGRHCLVETPEGKRVICHPRGKKSQAVVGDRVLWQAQQRRRHDREGRAAPQPVLPPGRDSHQVVCRQPRPGADPDGRRTRVLGKPVVAGADRGRGRSASRPSSRSNKSDLVEPFERAWDRLAPYRRMHYGVLPLSLRLSRAGRPRAPDASTWRARPRWCWARRARARAR